MIDMHTHSCFSPDSSAPPEEMIRQAQKLGLQYYAITEHVDFAKRNGAYGSDGDYEGYLKRIDMLRSKYRDAPRFLAGLEFGFDKTVPKELYLQVQRLAETDFVIGSVHVIDGEDCYFAESFQGYPQRERYTAYLKEVLLSLNACYDYHIVGHLGYVSRNAPYQDPKIHVSDYEDLIDAILKKIIEKDKTIELNTSVRSAGSITLPNEEILDRYRQLGGEHVTFASDAHDPSRIAFAYREAAELCKRLGFGYYDIFIRGARKKIKI